MSLLNQYTEVLTQEDMEYILNLPEVISAKEKIDYKSTGSIYFSVSLTPSIKNAIYEKIGLNILNIESIPMRWIKGDTLPHIDRCVASFENTYLMYLTDSVGELIIENNSFPISKGLAYVFPESTHHETINTGLEPRLLLGPMSEKAMFVGAPSNIFIRQDASSYEYSYDKESWNTISSWPFYIAGGTVEFTTDITFTSADNYFICNYSDLTIGSTSLKSDGTRLKIFIDGVSNYPGLIQNGNVDNNGCNNTYIFNLEVHAINGSTLADKAGWIGQKYFSKGANNNYIVNCSSDGAIGSNSSEGGGIVGSYTACSEGSSLTIIGCSSSGNIGINSGGIVGTYAGNTGDIESSFGGSVKCKSCWSTGTNISTGSGGIFGEYAGDNSYAYARFCYSTGTIGQNCGGIYGRMAGRGSYAEALNCYSLGNIGTNGGGIFGPYSGYNGGNTYASNCYSAGLITTTGNGIHGSSKLNDTQNNCYSANGSWSTTDANTNLTDYPEGSKKVGLVWVATNVNQPYELRNMGYSPYTKENIYFMGTEPTLNNTFPAVGNIPRKDMENENYTNEFNPFNYQSEWFYDMTDFIDENIVVGDKDESNRLQATYWNDLGNDVFDDWGYFYIYDVNSGKYYFPLLTPQNQDDGVITTQIFNTFGRTFTIKHGWDIRGVFKIDISVADASSFRFGAYGEMGSDGDEEFKNVNYNYNIDEQTKTLYYHCHREQGDDEEILYSYFIPKNESENFAFPYEVNYDSGNMSMKTIPLTQGVTIYFSKGRDVKEFIVNELKVGTSESRKIYKVTAGESANSSLISGKSYSILQKGKLENYYDENEEENVWRYQLVESDNTITINSTTGVISTTLSTPPGEYEIYVRNNGSYYISVYILIVNEASQPPPQPEPEVQIEHDYVFNNRNRIGTMRAYIYNGQISWNRYRSWWRRWAYIN